MYFKFYNKYYNNIIKSSPYYFFVSFLGITQGYSCELYECKKYRLT